MRTTRGAAQRRPRARRTTTTRTTTRRWRGGCRRAASSSSPSARRARRRRPAARVGAAAGAGRAEAGAGPAAAAGAAAAARARKSKRRVSAKCRRPGVVALSRRCNKEALPLSFGALLASATFRKRVRLARSTTDASAVTIDDRALRLASEAHASRRRSGPAKARRPRKLITKKGQQSLFTNRTSRSPLARVP